MSYFLLIFGLAVLVAGGEFLIKGGVGVAKNFHLSPLVIGMTIISCGTSAPELFVSAGAAVSGNSDIAVGNVVGSNIVNITLILGLTILIFPMSADRNSKVIDWPMMIIASVFFYIFAQDGIISLFEGALLFTSMIAFIVFLISNSRKKTKKAISSRGSGKINKDGIIEDYTLFSLDEVAHPKPRPLVLSILFIFIGLVGLYFGSEWLLEGAVQIARDLGMEERIIGITIVAFGTSVPELVTSCVAAFRKEKDIAIGNLIGSNVFNILGIIGLTAIITPINVSEQMLNSDMVWMIAVAALLLPMMIIGKKMGRFKGLMLSASYAAYIITLIIAM